MEIDSYQQCPCQSGKKIKFCCGKDLVHDLNTALSKERAGQSVAALEHLDRTIAKVGPQNCLLTIQTHILIAHGEIDKARAANTLLLQNNETPVPALHQRALIELAEGDLEKAIQSLQDAMDAITGNEIPISLASAFRIVGMAMLQTGDIIGGRAHLKYALDLKSDDTSLKDVLVATYRNPEVPLVFKGDFELAQPPAEETEWHKKYVNVHRALDRGQFRKALKFLNKIDANFPDLPIVVHGIALVNAFLGHRDVAAETLRRWQKLPGVEQHDAIEAEAVAQSCSTTTQVAALPIKRISFEIDDASAVTETLASNKRFALAANAPPHDPFEEGPAPKAVYFVLDKDELTSADDLKLADVPNAMCDLLLFGTQTDRRARVELIVVGAESATTILTLLQETLGLGTATAETELGDADSIKETVHWRPHLPRGITREQHEALAKEQFATSLERVADLNNASLEGKTLRQAAADPSLEVPARAFARLVSSAFDTLPGYEDAIKNFRSSLGLPELPAIDPAPRDLPNLSPWLTRQLDVAKLSNEELTPLYTQASMIGDRLWARKLVLSMLGRDDFDALPRDVQYALAAQVTEDSDEALDYLEQAKKVAQEAGEPIGLLLVNEFELRLNRGLTEKLPALMNTIRSNHLQEPDVEIEMTRVLHQHGLLDDQQLQQSRPAASAALPTSPALAGSPPSAVPAAKPETSGEEPSKLWLPE